MFYHQNEEAMLNDAAAKGTYPYDLGVRHGIELYVSGAHIAGNGIAPDLMHCDSLDLAFYMQGVAAGYGAHGVIERYFMVEHIVDLDAIYGGAA